jgi:hypothetical protein
VQIEIETEDYALSSELMGIEDPQVGQTTDAPGPATITYQGARIRESIDPTVVLVFIGSLVGSSVLNVGQNLFSSWLYDKLKNCNVKKLRINRQVVTIERQEIIRVIEEVTQEEK